MNETGMVFDRKGNPMLWHTPEGRSSGYLPDSQDLWEFLWEHRLKGGTGRLWGFAHTHPWYGRALPSSTDISTWEAIEQGLGQRLLWPIVTLSDVRYFIATTKHDVPPLLGNPERVSYREVDPSVLGYDIKGFDKLRELSGSKEFPGT